MIYSYNLEDFNAFVEDIIQQHTSQACWHWLKSKISNQSKHSMANFNLAFAAVPAKSGKGKVVITERQAKELQHFYIHDWAIDRLCRVWLLLHLDPENKTNYIRTIENLFLAAEMNEQVALYSALPLLAYPEHWRRRCAEGIRSNIGDVLQAIMCNNPYPSEQLEEAAWNQMVLKAFFTEKPVNQIIGLDNRANKELAYILSDYAHERWAAHRPVNPLLWRCVAPVLDEKLFADVERIAGSENRQEQMAAVLVGRQSDYSPAKVLLNNHPLLQKFAEDGSLNWEMLVEKTTDH